jgi:hypothetical protein
MAFLFCAFFALAYAPAGLSVQRIPIESATLKLIDFLLFFWSAQQHLFTVVGALAAMFKTSAQLRVENLALRQQLAVLRRSAPKPSN